MLSIIIATYNSQDVIRTCLRSIDSQTFRDFQVLIIDGQSSDKTLQIVNEFCHLDMQVLSEPDTGVYDAWNKALELAKSDWLTFIGSDDCYSDINSLSLLMDQAIAAKDAPFVYGKLKSINTKGKPIGVSGCEWRPHDGFKQKYLFAQFPFPIMGNVYRKSFFGTERFDQGYKIIGDMDLTLRQLNIWRGGPPTFIDAIIVDMSHGGVSTNPKHFMTNLKESYRCRQKNGLPVFNLGMAVRTIKLLGLLFVIRVLGKRAYAFTIGAYRWLKMRIHRRRLRS